MSARERAVGWCLVGVILSLLMIGIVNATLIRHAIQSIPAIIALTAVVKRAAWAKHTALAVFLFWFLIMLLIWSYFLGFVSPMSAGPPVYEGRSTPAEVVFTITTGASCTWGFVSALRASSTSSLSSRIVAWVMSIAVQVGALVASMQPAFNAS